MNSRTRSMDHSLQRGLSQGPPSARLLALCLLCSATLLIAACQPAPLPPDDLAAPATEYDAGSADASNEDAQDTTAEAAENSGSSENDPSDTTEELTDVAAAPTVTPETGPEPEPSPTALLLNEVAELEAFLREEGIGLTFNQEVKLDYLPGMARIYEIGSGTDSLQLHQYPTVAETDEAAGCFSPDAMFVDDLEDPGNPFKVEWLGSPHVFRSQNLLATYIGDDPEILEALTQAFGPQFAGF